MSEKPLNQISRRHILRALAATGVGNFVFQRALAIDVEKGQQISPEMIQQAEWIAGLELKPEERDDIAQSLSSLLNSAATIRENQIDVGTLPAQVFRPDFFYDQAAKQINARVQPDPVAWSVDESAMQLAESDLPFASIRQQATLLSRGKLSSSELTKLYLARLHQADPKLKCVVTWLDDFALEQAVASDQRRQTGKTRGILDGIPWAAKDIIALPPWKTTWGAEPFKDQIRHETATVAQRLSEAGAVVLAKVSVGALAWGDQWFGGMTRNPWNTEEGSSGSSAGSAACAAAGLTSFAIGSETLGSIVSPCMRCRTSGLRPTFGRVSRFGCMPLAWSMDKIGPIARHVEDLGFVFSHLLGIDHRDPALVDRPFQFPSQREVATLKIGVTGDRLSKAERAAVDYLESQGAEMVDVQLKSELPVGAMSFILGVEASAAFEYSFRQDRAADYGLWPRTFRNSQFVSAIHYLQANRLRGQLITETEQKLLKVDALIGANDLSLTNLTGHPSIVFSCGSDEQDGHALPGMVKLTAAAYREDRLLSIAQMLQEALPPRPNRPTT